MRVRNALFTAVVAISLTGASGASGAAGRAQDVKPYEPKPEDCRVAPISDDAFAAALREVRILEATPRAFGGFESFDDPLEADTLSEADLPAGAAADAGTVATVTALEQEYAACHNAGAFRRAAGLMTGEALLVAVALSDRFSGASASATPIPLPAESQIPTVAVSGVRVFPDGRAGAVVDWGVERNFVLYEQTEGQWRIADEISLY